MNFCFLSHRTTSVIHSLIISSLLSAMLLSCGGGSDSTSSGRSENTPDTLTFTVSPDSVEPGTQIETNTVTITGITEPVSISISGGEYRVNSEPYTSQQGMVNSGDTLTVRATAPGNYSDSLQVHVTTGARTSSFEVYTLAPPDRLPDTFVLTGPDVSIAPQQWVTSLPVSITGINRPVDVSITGGEFSVDNGEFSNTIRTISNGQTLQVRLYAADYGQDYDAELSVGNFVVHLSATTNTRLTACEESQLSDADWSFADIHELDDWTVVSEKHDSQLATIEWSSDGCGLTISPNWASVPNNPDSEYWEDNWDRVFVYGMLSEHRDMRLGKISLSLYFPDVHLGNPWANTPYWGESAHHLGTQFVLIDNTGQRIYLVADNNSSWMNSFAIAYSDITQASRGFLHSDPEAPVRVAGIWGDLEIELGYEATPWAYNNQYDASAFDMTKVAGVGVVFNYALEEPDNLPNSSFYDNGAPQDPLYLDEIRLMPYDGEIPTPTPTPMPTPEPSPHPNFSRAVYLDETLNNFTPFNGWGGNYDFGSTTYAKSGTKSIEASFYELWAALQFGALDQDISNFSQFHFSIFTPEGTPNTRIRIQFCESSDEGCAQGEGVIVETVQGAWQEYAINLSEFEIPQNFSEIRFQFLEEDERTVYLDNVGFDLL